MESYFSPDGREIWSVKLGGRYTSFLKSYHSPDGRGIWSVPKKDSPVCGWQIIENTESRAENLLPLSPNKFPSAAFPWQSSRGYEDTDDGWVLSSTRKRLLWLPHRWRSGERSRVWSGQFLGLGHVELQEIVILEFFE